MPILSFIDLDDTFIMTSEKRPRGDAAFPAAVDTLGNVSSFMTSKQARLLAALGDISVVVPTTGRTLGALQRVHVAFESFAISNHGAVITEPGGAIHAPWADVVYPSLRQRREQLERAVRRMVAWSRELTIDTRIRVIEEHAVPTYISAKGPSSLDMQRLAMRLELRQLGSGLRVHLNGRNLALLPLETCKRKAVAHVVAAFRSLYGGDLLTLGFGDSLSDTSFLSECDFASTPKESQIARALAGLARRPL
jgi:hypothetical protein